MSVFFDTAKKLSRIGTGTGKAFTDGYRAATANLDQPGEDVNPEPFRAGEVVDKSAGIAKVISRMIGARRERANAVEIRRRQAVEEGYKNKQMSVLDQKLAAGKTKRYGVGGQEFDLTDVQAATLTARMANKGAGGTGTQPISKADAEHYGVTSFVPDPNNPDVGTANSREIDDARQSFRDATNQDFRERREKRITDLAKRREQNRSMVAETRLALQGLDKEVSDNERSGEMLARADINRRLPLLGDTPFEGVDKKAIDIAVEARDKAARELGIHPRVIRKGDVTEPVYLSVKGAKKKVAAYDLTAPENRAAIENFIVAYKARARKAAETRLKARRAELQSRIDMTLEQDKMTLEELRILNPGFQSSEGQDFLDQPAAEPESRYTDPAEVVKSWTQDEDEDEDF